MRSPRTHEVLRYDAARAPTRAHPSRKAAPGWRSPTAWSSDRTATSTSRASIPTRYSATTARAAPSWAAVSAPDAAGWTAPTGILFRPRSLPGIQGLQLNPSSVRGGKKVRGQVSLDLPARPGGVEVTISRSRPAAAFPVHANGTVADGATTDALVLQTRRVRRNASVTITATAAGESVAQSLTVPRR